MMGFHLRFWDSFPCEVKKKILPKRRFNKHKMDLTLINSENYKKLSKSWLNLISLKLSNESLK